MADETNDQLDNYLSNYDEIIQGYSEVKLLDGPDFLFRHPTNKDIVKIIRKNTSLIDEAVSLGVEKEADQVKFVIDQNWWTRPEEDHLNANLQVIERLHRTHRTVNFNSERKRILNQIKTHEKIVNELYDKRNEYLGMTAENYANNKITEYSISLLACDLDQKVIFSCPDEFYDLEEIEVWKYRAAYMTHALGFSPTNVKRIAAGGFFQNLLFICDESCNGLYGKPVVALTKHQADLLLYGKLYRSAIKNSETQVPEFILNNPDKLIEWAESSGKSRNLLEKRAGGGSNRGGEAVGKGATALFGSKEDMKDMGVQNSAGSLLQRAKNQGGSIGMNERTGIT